MPPAFFAVEPLPRRSRSSTTTSRTPLPARWYAIEAPTMPPPTMTTSARSTPLGSSSSGLLRRNGRRSDADHREHRLVQLEVIARRVCDRTGVTATRAGDELGHVRHRRGEEHELDLTTALRDDRLQTGRDLHRTRRALAQVLLDTRRMAHLRREATRRILRLHRHHAGDD